MHQDHLRSAKADLAEQDGVGNCWMRHVRCGPGCPTEPNLNELRARVYRVLLIIFVTHPYAEPALHWFSVQPYELIIYKADTSEWSSLQLRTNFEVGSSWAT